MLFNVSQLLLLLVFFIGLAALFNAKWWRLLIASVGALTMAIETMSVLIASSLIDYKFYAHFKLDVATTVGGFFLWETIGTIAALILSGVLIYKLSQKIAGKWPLILASFLSLFGLFSPEGIGSNIAEINSIHFAQEKAFQEALSNAGLEEHTLENKIKAQSGKNIIAIFMESLEIGFIQENLAHLTPNMNRLKGEMNFYPMEQVDGGNYTIGALYTYLTGIPMYFKNHGNNVFDEVLSYKLSSVPTVLEKAGYYQEYLAGKPAFAGMDRMFELMGVNVKSEQNYDPKYTIVPWGLHDKDLFEIVDQELDRLYELEQPFAYYISTISTHSPDGVEDARVDAAFPAQASRLELMALALDDYIGKLVDKLKQEGRLENTAIYIMPDHLLMSDYARVLEDMKEPRELFLLTNTTSSKHSNGQKISQLDIAAMLLEGAKVEHNLTFLGDQVEGDVKTALSERKLPLLQLNESAITKENKLPTGAQIFIDYRGKEVELQADEIKMISRNWFENDTTRKSYLFVGHEVMETKRGVNLLVDKKGKPQLFHFAVEESVSEVDALVERLNKVIENNQRCWLLVHESVGENLPQRREELTALGFKKLGQLKNSRAYLGYYADGFASEKENGYGLEADFSRAHQKSERSAAEIAADTKKQDKWIAHACGMVDGIDYTNFLEALDHNYAMGFRYFELDILETSDGVFVVAHDWPHWKKRASYEGETPVSRDVFMQQKPLGKYTPMDMDAINKWFTDHPDAILITDKINDPVRFAAAFVDKSRLMMELFSMDAVKAARGLGLKDVLITDQLTHELKGDWVDELKALEVGSLAMSIKTVMKNPAHFKMLKKAGIKTYAYHIGGHDLMDEAFMARYGMDLTYGLYADQWDLR